MRFENPRIRINTQRRQRIVGEDEFWSVLLILNQFMTKIPSDYIDLFLIHDPLSGTNRRLDTYKALMEAKATGKIRNVGVSN